jgi:ribosomal protein L14
MLFVGTKLKPVDNAGVKQVKCIRIISKTKKYAQVGDLLGVVVKKFKMKKKLVKKIMYYGLVISMKAYLKRIDGT